MDEHELAATTSGNGESGRQRSESAVPSLIRPEDVNEFREILRRDFGEEVGEVEAWERLSDLVTLVRMLLGPLPEDPSLGTSSNVLQP
jgi:hypothetical protein